ncbi:phage tail sheath C-terminal domain-containing protein [Hyphomicrobium sp.]|uniref:phage tail sheath C-terminal domain-containing protein n=1 Tax=Hyphomicrobium sp. TaxID=82 RepID=UPI001D864A6E|nr:phage tail sheath C-terminal domain-containing protein [Hyphomicrobium sp.]MBY0559874.1 phage tail sheath subtilisin-like domain-containing protein [Hyphomicrobium sp.]
MVANDTYLHGIDIVEIDDGIRPIQTATSSIIGLIGTAPDADEDVFPLNEPVLIIGDRTKAALLGATGTLPAAMRDILSVFGAPVVLVRVDAGQTTPQTWSNLIGDPTTKTGVYAFLTAWHKVKAKPRMIIAPGWTGLRPSNGIKQINVGTAGQYDKVPTISFTNAQGDTGAGAAAVAHVVAGALSSITVTNPGSGYTSPPTVVITRAAGDGKSSSGAATAVLGKAKNPVAAAIEGILPNLRAIALIEGPNISNTEAIDFRQDFGTSRTMIIDPNVLVWDITVSDYVSRSGVALAAAMQSYMDNTYGFWWSFSNQAVPNIGGIDRPVTWDLEDPTTDANFLNQNQVATIVRVDSQSQGGFRFWGLRTTSADPLWAFLSVRRTADMIYDSIVQGFLWMLDRPFSAQLIIDGVETVNYYLRSLKARGATIDGSAWIDPNLNSIDQLVAGKLRIEFDFEPPAPIERITFGARRNPNYYDVMISDVLRDLPTL